jgi:hypothetical protein
LPIILGRMWRKSVRRVHKDKSGNANTKQLVKAVCLMWVRNVRCILDWIKFSGCNGVSSSNDVKTLFAKGYSQSGKCLMDKQEHLSLATFTVRKIWELSEWGLSLSCAWYEESNGFCHWKRHLSHISNPAERLDWKSDTKTVWLFYDCTIAEFAVKHYLWNVKYSGKW